MLCTHIFLFYCNSCIYNIFPQIDQMLTPLIYMPSRKVFFTLLTKKPWHSAREEHEHVRIWKRQNLFLSDSENVRIWKRQNLKTSESENVGILKNRKFSENLKCQNPSKFENVRVWTCQNLSKLENVRIGLLQKIALLEDFRNCNC